MGNRALAAAMLGMGTGLSNFATGQQTVETEKRKNDAALNLKRQELAMKLAVPDKPTSSQRDYEFYQGLDPAGQQGFLSVKGAGSPFSYGMPGPGGVPTKNYIPKPESKKAPSEKEVIGKIRTYLAWTVTRDGKQPTAPSEKELNIYRGTPAYEDDIYDPRYNPNVKRP